MPFIRDIFQDLLDDSKDPRITILSGARQVGKTYLLKQLSKELKNDHYFNLEESDDLRLFNAEEKKIIELIKSSGTYVFIDEFQYVENISKIFKIIYDKDSWKDKLDTKIYASGSSAIEMHKHLKESLVGRYKKYWIKPLSFSEFLTNREIDTDLDVFLKFGALPGTYNPKTNPTNRDKQDYLEKIQNAYIQRDIKALVAEENLAAFNNLVYILADNQGQISSSSNLARGIKVSVPTVERYLSVLEQTFSLYILKSFSGNLSNELKKSKKYYLYDLGVRNSLLKDFSSYKNRKDKGVILETFVYHQLLNFIDSSDTDIFFWRTSDQYEIDFIVNKNRIPIPIEVKSSVRRPELFPSIKKFMKAYPKAPFAVVINDKFDEEYYENDRKVYYISFENIASLQEILSQSSY